MFYRIMFWLFKRKKVADKKAITPCMCVKDEDVPDNFILQDYKIRRSAAENILNSRFILGESGTRNERKGYHKLRGEEEVTHLQRPFPMLAQVEGGEYTSSNDSNSEVDSDFLSRFTESDDEQEELTCNVCERSFKNIHRLEHHQQKNRHYGCSICDSIFPGLMALELHKETLDHWSDYELKCKSLQQNDSDSDELEEHLVYSKRERDELRKLLL